MGRKYRWYRSNKRHITLGIIPYSGGVTSIPQPYAYAFGILATQPR